jgi:hypothetical protein
MRDYSGTTPIIKTRNCKALDRLFLETNAPQLFRGGKTSVKALNDAIYDLLALNE